MHVSTPFFVLCESQISTVVFFIVFITLMLCYIEVFFLHCIGSIGTASFYGGAAAARPHPRAQPGEFHVIAHLTIVLLVLVISSMILT